MASKTREKAGVRQRELSWCSLRPQDYATISAKRTCCRTGVEAEESMPWIIERYPGTDKMAFCLLKGPTGWEAWNIRDLLSHREQGWWAACVGTPGRWDRVMVNGSEVLEVLRECGYESM